MLTATRLGAIRTRTGGLDGESNLHLCFATVVQLESCMIITGGPQDGGPKFYVYEDHEGLHIQHARAHIIIPPEDLESFARIVLSHAESYTDLLALTNSRPEKAA